jgi:hypothetical protein
VPRVDRERRQDRQQAAAKVLGQELLLAAVDLLRPQQPDPLGGEPRREILQEALVLLLHELVAALGDGGQDLGRRESVRAAVLVPRVDTTLQPGHPDHEELVEVGAEDRQELDPLQQGHSLVLGLGQDAAVELQPGQLPVDQRLGIHAPSIRGMPLPAAPFCPPASVR